MAAASTGNGRKPGPLNAAERRQKSLQAYQLATRKITYGEISKALDISSHLVGRLVQEEQERQWAGRDISDLEAEQRRSIETYQEVIRRAWERLSRTQDHSLNVSGIFNAIINSQSKIDEITGIRSTTLGDQMAKKAQAYLDLLDAQEAGVKDLSE
jgi:hypothetical protein